MRFHDNDELQVLESGRVHSPFDVLRNSEFTLETFSVAKVSRRSKVQAPRRI